MVFDRVTDRGRKAFALARDEAVALDHFAIDTGHILLGLILEESGVAATVLGELGVVEDTVRSELLARSEFLAVPKGVRQIPFTPGAKLALEHADEEAKSLSHNYVGTEHLLLGLLREPQSVAAAILQSQGCKLDDARAAVLEQLGHVDGMDPFRVPSLADCPTCPARMHLGYLHADWSAGPFRRSLLRRFVRRLLHGRQPEYSLLAYRCPSCGTVAWLQQYDKPL